MKKRILLLVFTIMFAASGFAQKLWSPASLEQLDGLPKAERSTTPLRAVYLTLNMDELRSRLHQAPLRGSGTDSAVMIPFPDGKGEMHNYRIYETSVLDPALAALHPEIKTYTGQDVKDPAATISLSLTPFGLHTMVLSSKGTWYAEPYTKDHNNYIVYDKREIKFPRPFSCGVTAGLEEASREISGVNAVDANDGVLRRYRLAMASSVEYSAFHINAAGLNNGTLAQKKAAVLAAMTVTVARINGIYERDLAVTLQIIPTNENIIFVTSDNLSNSDTMISQIQTIIDNAIGVDNYDIGHVVGTGEGGVAQLGSVCGPSKARGVTGRPNPVGDPFDVDYVAHEMGHQFGATHTFNNAYQREPSTAVEPGSGSTIMAYAGISPPDVQANSDAYFHTISMTQIFSFLNNNGGFCAEIIPIANTAPVITPFTTSTIPVGTPFVLRGSATDANGDALTYCWEQINANGGAATIDNAPLSTSTSGPNFRSLPPSTSPSRYFPSLQNSYPEWEVLPTVARAMNFALTVRDNKPGGGQTARRDKTVVLSAAAGPFVVTSQNTQGVSWTQGSTQTITWNVAGTTAAPINTTSVNILLSTDGGQTYPTVLLANTPNDGSQAITVPNVAAPYCRIMVEAVNNIYYALNATPFAIGYTVTNSCNTYTNNNTIAIPDGTGTTNPGFGTVINSVISVPMGTTITDVNVTVNANHTYIGDLIFQLNHPDNTAVTLWAGNCGTSDNLAVTFDDAAGAVVCASPTAGTFAPADPLSAFNGKTANGQWVLLAADAFQGDTGSLVSWSLQVCSQTVALGTNEFGLDSFSLYPNPNNGSFTVEFTSATTNDVQVLVHDLRGREIMNKSYQNSGAFSGNINMGNVQSGVYLVTVQDGSRKEVKKIVVQ
jgi:subtilisin-like proprotein convertase family protein